MDGASFLREYGQERCRRPQLVLGSSRLSGGRWSMWSGARVEVNVAHRTETVRVGGTPVQVLRGGSGRPVLVMHGIEGPEGWLAFHEALARDGDVWAPSHPGYGETP